MSTLTPAFMSRPETGPQPLASRASRCEPGVTLSPRESEVLALIVKGFTAEESARLMNVSRHTVITFVRRLYAKLDVRSKAEAIFEAYQLGLLDR